MNLASALACVGGPALAVPTGTILKNKRMGMLSGSLIGFLVIRAIVAAQAGHSSALPLSLWLSMSFGLASGGAILGLTAASLRQSVPKTVRKYARTLCGSFRS